MVLQTLVRYHISEFTLMCQIEVHKLKKVHKFVTYLFVVAKVTRNGFLIVCLMLLKDIIFYIYWQSKVHLLVFL